MTAVKLELLLSLDKLELLTMFAIEALLVPVTTDDTVAADVEKPELKLLAIGAAAALKLLNAAADEDVTIEDVTIEDVTIEDVIILLEL